MRNFIESQHFEIIKAKLKESKEIVVFGAGETAKNYVQEFKLDVKYFVDNDSAKWNGFFQGKKIYSPQKLLNDKGKIIVVTGSQYEKEISQQLCSMGLVEGIDFIAPKLLCEQTILQESKENMWKPLHEFKNNRRILLDMSQLGWFNNQTGIQRVVKNLIIEGYNQNEYEFVAVQRFKDILVEPMEWLEKNKIISSNNLKVRWRKVNPKKGDVLLLADAIWGEYNEFSSIIKCVQKNGGQVINIIYDLIPIKYSSKYDECFVECFKNMIDEVLNKSDGIISISRTAADEFYEFAKIKKAVIDRKFEIGWFHLGTNLNDKIVDNKISNDIKSIFKNNIFLVVGTIDPRKGHEVALNAFEILWNNGLNYTLCFAGKVGTKVESLMERIYNHKQFGKKLFFLDNPSDEELIYCYKQSQALIFPSFAEGFGLPVIEAAYFKLPMILSNIPIFYEIAHEKALYFKVNDYKDLARMIIKFNTLKNSGELPNLEDFKFQNWEESLKQIFQIVFKNNIYKTL